MLFKKFYYNYLNIYFDTPALPNVRVRDISGRMHDLLLRCDGSLIQSSQYLKNNYIYDLKTNPDI